MEIIVKGGDHDKKKFGKTRSEQEENWRKEGFHTMTDEQLSKLRYLERKNREKFGLRQNFIRLNDVDEVD